MNFVVTSPLTTLRINPAAEIPAVPPHRCLKPRQRLLMSPRCDLAAGVYVVLELFLQAERRIRDWVSFRASTRAAFRYHLSISFTSAHADLRLTSLSQLRIIMSGAQHRKSICEGQYAWFKCRRCSEGCRWECAFPGDADLAILDTQCKGQSRVLRRAACNEYPLRIARNTEAPFRYAVKSSADLP